MLDQSLEETKAARNLAEARAVEIIAKDRVIATDEKLFERYRRIIAASDELVAKLEKGKCSQFSVLFGLIKIKRC